jgi:hypothetical protein
MVKSVSHAVSIWVTNIEQRAFKMLNSEQNYKIGNGLIEQNI